MAINDIIGIASGSGFVRLNKRIGHCDTPASSRQENVLIVDTMIQESVVDHLFDLLAAQGRVGKDHASQSAYRYDL